MSLLLVGTNHRHANVELREHLANDRELVGQFLSHLKSIYENIEIIVISTCNRFEIYVWRTTHSHPDHEDLIKDIADLHRIPAQKIKDCCYCYRQDQAVTHLFRVTSAMDSLLVGELQISGQVADALNLARKHQTAGPYLTQLFQSGLNLAKKIRRQTDVSEGHFSLGSVAGEFAEKIFGSLSEKSFLVLGAGKMGTSALQHLIANGAKEVFIANRDMARARNLAGSLPCAQVVSWDRMEETLAKVDVVISCVAANEPVLTRRRFEKISDRRLGLPMLIIDLGLPRNVEGGIGQLPWVHLYDLDALGQVLEHNNDRRRTQLEQCRGLIEKAAGEYQQWQQRRTVIPAIVTFRRKIHDIGRQELQWLEGKLGNLAPEDWELIETMVHRMVHKILHDPTTEVSRQARDQRGTVYAGILQKLFALNPDLRKEFPLPKGSDELNGSFKKFSSPPVSVGPILNKKR
jgi:glutamyl-tRNA reductase